VSTLRRRKRTWIPIPPNFNVMWKGTLCVDQVRSQEFLAADMETVRFLAGKTRDREESLINGVPFLKSICRRRQNNSIQMPPGPEPAFRNGRRHGKCPDQRGIEQARDAFPKFQLLGFRRTAIRVKRLQALMKCGDGLRWIAGDMQGQLERIIGKRIIGPWGIACARE